MKKTIIALGLAAAALCSTMTVSAERLWQYNDALTIDVGEADHPDQGIRAGDPEDPLHHVLQSRSHRFPEPGHSGTGRHGTAGV